MTTAVLSRRLAKIEPVPRQRTMPLVVDIRPNETEADALAREFPNGLPPPLPDGRPGAVGLPEREFADLLEAGKTIQRLCAKARRPDGQIDLSSLSEAEIEELMHAVDKAKALAGVGTRSGQTTVTLPPPLRRPVVGPHP